MAHQKEFFTVKLDVKEGVCVFEDYIESIICNIMSYTFKEQFINNGEVFLY
jgi:hypothetical protein